MNLGLRYEVEWPITERFNRVVTGFAFDAASPIEAQAQANYARAPIAEIPISSFRAPGGLLFAGDTATGRALFRPDRNNFLPRVGMAWSALLYARRTTTAVVDMAWPLRQQIAAGPPIVYRDCTAEWICTDPVSGETVVELRP